MMFVVKTGKVLGSASDATMSFSFCTISYKSDSPAFQSRASRLKKLLEIRTTPSCRIEHSTFSDSSESWQDSTSSSKVRSSNSSQDPTVSMWRKLLPNYFLWAQCRLTSAWRLLQTPTTRSSTWWKERGLQTTSRSIATSRGTLSLC